MSLKRHRSNPVETEPTSPKRFKPEDNSKPDAESDSQTEVQTEVTVEELVPPTKLNEEEELLAKGQSAARELLKILYTELSRPDCVLVETVLACATKILAKEPNLLKLSSPIICVGDIHAEWYDLKKVFQLAGDVEDGTRFLFLGDYVDRGFYGVECLAFLAAKKILCPNDIFLIRGNHEDAMISSIYGHKKECEVYYSYSIYLASCEFFKALPLCAIVDEKYFCCHGGIPNVDLDALSSIERSIPYVDTLSQPQSAIVDLLWSDPSELNHQGVKPNLTRGCGSLFSEQALDRWHHANGLALTIRAHQLAKGGVFWQFNNKLVTVFSASDYCRQMGNDGGILKLTADAPPEGITWTSKDVGERKKIFGRDTSLAWLQDAGSDSDDSSEEGVNLFDGDSDGEDKVEDSSESEDETEQEDTKNKVSEQM